MQELILMKKKYTVTYLILIIIFGLGLRFYYTPFDVPIVTDGFISFVYAIKTIFDGQLPIGFDTNNSGWGNFLSLIFLFLDKTDPLFLMNVQRVVSIIFSCLTIIPAFFIFKKFVNYKISLIGSMILMVEPRLFLISIEGINFSIYFFMIVTIIALALQKKRTCMIFAFIGIAIAALIRFEGILLVIPMIIVILKNRKSNLESILLIMIMVLLISCIILPISIMRIDATSENCYQLLSIEFCGNDGIFSGLLQKSSSMENKISGIPDLDDSIYYDNENMMQKFVYLSLSNLSKFTILLMIPVFMIISFLTIISLKKSGFFEKRNKFLELGLWTFFLIIPSFYAYGRDISEIRYVLILIPLLISFSLIGINYFSKSGKSKRIMILVVIVVLVLSLLFINLEERDRVFDREAFQISEIIIQKTSVINEFSGGGYIKTALLFDYWPDLPGPTISGTGINFDFEKRDFEKRDFDYVINTAKSEDMEYIIVDSEVDDIELVRQKIEDDTSLVLDFDYKENQFYNEYFIVKITEEE